DLLGDAVDHIVPVIRSLCARHQKRMVIAGRRAGHRQGGKTSQPVGHQITVLLPSLKCLPILFSVHPSHTAFLLPNSISPSASLTHPRTITLWGSTDTRFPAGAGSSHSVLLCALQRTSHPVPGRDTSSVVFLLL